MTGTSLVWGGVLVTLLMPSPAGQQTRHYVSEEECGFEFDYPADWVVSPLPVDRATRCRVMLRPDDFAERMDELDVDVYTVQLGRERGLFLQVAADHYFDLVRGRFVVLGRQGLQAPAETLITDRWHGLTGVATIGCFHESRGGYAGLCDERRFVLRDDADRIWAMSGGAQSEEVFEMVLASFRFTERENAPTGDRQGRE